MARGKSIPTMHHSKAKLGPSLIEVVTAIAIIGALVIGAYAP